MLALIIHLFLEINRQRLNGSTAQSLGQPRLCQVTQGGSIRDAIHAPFLHPQRSTRLQLPGMLPAIADSIPFVFWSDVDEGRRSRWTHLLAPLQERITLFHHVGG